MPGAQPTARGRALEPSGLQVMARFSCAAFLLLHGSCIAAQLAAPPPQMRMRTREKRKSPLDPGSQCSQAPGTACDTCDLISVRAL